MSDRDDAILARLGDRARARAEGAARIEAPLRGGGSRAAVDDVLAAIDAVPPRRARRRFPWAVAIAPLAAAAAIALVLRAPSRGAPLGDYSVAVTGRADTMRAASDVEATALEARAGAVEQVLVRPRDAVRESVDVRVLARDASGATQPLPVAPEVSELGVVRFDVRGEQLAGVTEVLVGIAPAADRGREVVVRIPVEKKDDLGR